MSISIVDIYAAINPMPAMLTAKGKISPNVSLVIEANASIAITMNWVKRHKQADWDRDYQTFIGTYEEALAKALAFISDLPSADEAKLHDFMGQLGCLIDAGKSDGIVVDYMNPLLDTMKRLSENIITYQPSRRGRQSPQGIETPHD